jgi:hypothetical protein
MFFDVIDQSHDSVVLPNRVEVPGHDCPRNETPEKEHRAAEKPTKEQSFHHAWEHTRSARVV